MSEGLSSHFGQWWAVAVWILLYAVMLAFVPFYRRVQRKPSVAYIAFVVAFAVEMFGVPFSAYIIAAVVGTRLPEGVLWGHTLSAAIGHTGMYIAIGCFVAGIALIVAGWSKIYRDYWRKDAGTGDLVTGGIYRHVRHPQYTGFLLITIGMILEWATLPLLLMWPVLVVLYVRLARREERDMEAEFGVAYRHYRETTGMFLPRLRKRRTLRAGGVTP